MRKFCFAAFPALFIAVSANAAPFNGPYLGAQGEYQQFDAGNLSDPNGNPQTIKHATGISPGIFAGYGKTFNRFYLGGEVEGNIDGGDYESYSGGSASTNTKWENKSTYGASLRAGYLPLPNTLVYGRIGVVRSKFSLETGYASTRSARFFNAAYEDTLTGIRVGVGAESAITEHWLVRLDWAYTAYENATADTSYYPGFFDPAAAVTSGKASLSPDANSFRIGIVYNF